MTALDSRAAVSFGNGDSEVRVLSLPDDVSRLRVESSAVCGTDVMLHDHGLSQPAVLGHHTIGRIEHLTPTDAEAIRLPVGTRVAVEEYVGCGSCVECTSGNYRLCAAVDLWTGGERVGLIPADRGSGLHGGNAELMEISARHVLHPLSDGLASSLAAWTLPFANAIDWTVHAGGAGPGKRVVVIGPGYHGLACVAAALTAGAEDVIAIGRSSSTSSVRLALARDMGASAEVSDADAPRRIMERRGPVDVVIDTIGHPSTVATAISLLGRFGTLVVAGLAGDSTSLDPTAIVRKLLTVRGVRGRAPRAVREAIRLLEEGRTPLDKIPTHLVPLEDVGTTLRDMHEGQGPRTPHIVIDPWLSSRNNSPRSSDESVASIV